MQNMVQTFIASASELQSSDIYMTIKAILFTAPDANLNGVRCTAAFLDDIAENQEQYIGLPLCADVNNLVHGQYKKLGHCYNPTTGTFSSAMIGSFYKFESVDMDDGKKCLVGYARVMKRNKSICKALSELFVDNALKFSFEITCGSYEQLEDGTYLIDKADNNYLEGMCVVSFPACPEAAALQLVAEIADCDIDLRKEAEIMPVENMEVAEQEAQEEMVVAEQDEVQEPAATEQIAETEASAEQEDEAVDGEATEVAEVIVTEEHYEADEVHAFDTETNEETCERATRSVVTTTVAEENHETGVAAEAEANVAAVLAEIQKAIQDISKELAEIKEASANRVIASAKEEEEQVANPFLAEISTPVKYSLLESVDKPTKYSLLDRA